MEWGLFFVISSYTAIISLATNVTCPQTCTCDWTKGEVKMCSGYGKIPSFTNYSDVKILNLQSNNIPSINKGDLSEFLNLENLDLRHNGLKTVSAGSFSGLDMLTRLDLSNNSISSLAADVFCNMTSLRYLLLKYNILVTLTSGLFHNLPQLYTLSLSGNEISHIENDSFSLLPGLKYFRLDQNNLSSIPSALFDFMPNLNNLNLHNNSITQIPAYAFSSIPNVSTITLENNRISEIDIYAFEIKHKERSTLLETKIDKLNLVNNQLTGDVPQALNDLVYATHLDISNNGFSTIRGMAFYRLSKLQYLRISNMPNLKEFDPYAFQQLYNLKDIHITGNPKLKRLPERLFADSNSIEHVWLENNALETLPYKLFNWKNLRLANFGSNDFNCDCKLQWMKNFDKWPTKQLQNHVKTLTCKSPFESEDVPIYKFDFDRLLCTQPDHASKVVAGVISCLVTLLLVSMCVLAYRYRKKCMFKYRQFRYSRHKDDLYTIDAKYSDLNKNGDIKSDDLRRHRDKENLL